MALRGGSSLLRSLARLSNSHAAASSRLSSGNTRQHVDYSFLTHNKSVIIGDVRLFSTSPRAYNVATELSEALKHEIDAEKDLEAQHPAASPNMFPGFTVTTKEAEVRLTKSHGNESILVVFNVNHSVEIAEEFDDPNNTPSPVALPPFSIEITKGDERLCFHLELVEAEQPGEYDFQVEEFYLAPAVKGTEEDVPSHVYATSGKYIDSTIQELLYVRYLEERGFDGEFLKNLVAFASSHEHKLYINLLNKMKAFIAK
ncbi:cri-3 [Pristionchus pacificus]|nr:cri-3 [Pristionchus pacificus]